MYRSTFSSPRQLVGGDWPASCPGPFTPPPPPPEKEFPDTHPTGGWVGPRAGKKEVEKKKFLALPEHEYRPLGLPARNKSLF
jgi:hypothetical protein